MSKYRMITDLNAKLITKSVRNSVLELDGDIAEVGVSIGDSAEVICKAKGSRPLHLFDTFEGHPVAKIGKYDLHQTAGKHAANLDTVKERLARFKEVSFYKGVFPETAGTIMGKKFCVVNLDTDLYKSTYESLEFFSTRMVIGGVIIVHDALCIPGVACAIVDFSESHQGFAKSIEFLSEANQCFIAF